MALYVSIFAFGIMAGLVFYFVFLVLCCVRQQVDNDIEEGLDSSSQITSKRSSSSTFSEYYV